ncbi:hypothetical protein LLG95_09525 [bacterium]|nr:hypothetical protein [bacterium]
MTHRFLTTIIIALLISSSAFAQDDPTMVRLFDTNKQSNAPLTAQTLDRPSGWTLVPEDNTTHTFTGDAVFMNDKLAVVLRKQSSGVEVHYKSAAGFKIAAGLAHMNAAAADRLASFKIVENSSGAVAMETAFYGPDNRSALRRLTLRLTTGEGTIEVTPGPGAVAIGIDSPTNYLIVPDFFGDDLVFGEKSFTGRAVPAENMCLNLFAGNDAMMMCVWQSSRQQAWMLAAADHMTTLRIDCMPDKKIWLAFMQADIIWRTTQPAEKFNAPFPAKWRRNMTRGDGTAVSFDAEAQPKASDDKQVVSIIYPLDRVQDTPLTTVLPTDVMRNTLGVGPCQYILAVEGMAAEGDPTPNNVMEWVEKQFDAKKDKKAADDIKERLDVMTKHIAEANGRIKAYAEFAAASKPKLAADPKAAPWLAIIGDMARYAGSGLTASPADASKLAAAVIALIGKPDSAAECKKLGEQLREIGATQDHALARCRMALRRLKQEGRAMDGSSKSPAAVAEVQKQADQIFAQPR